MSAFKKTLSAVGDGAGAVGTGTKRFQDLAGQVIASSKKGGAGVVESVSTASKKGGAAKLDDVIEGATDAQIKAGKNIEESGVFKTFLKNNSGKLAIAGVTAASLGIYMAVTGESNPAKALGQMVGEVGAGAGEGLGAAVLGIFDGLGLTPYLTYIQWGCAASSCLCCLLLVTYFIIQFKK